MNQASIAVFCDWLEKTDVRTIRNLDELMAAIALQVAAIEEELVSIVRKVMHNSRFQKLESSFRSIFKLIAHSSQAQVSIRNKPTSRQVNVFVLDVSAQELELDLGANSHRRTWMYDKLYRKRFDLLIGKQNMEIEGYSPIHPFSLMIVDFDLSFPKVTDPTRQINLDVLKRLAKIGEECFCMMLLALAPEFFGESFTSFSRLEGVMDVGAILNQPRYQSWHEFRTQEDSRMVGLTLPRVLVRKPFKNYRMRETGIFFSECDGFLPQDKYLWGSSAFAVVQPIIRSFQQYDWFSDVCGVDRDSEVFTVSTEVEEPSYDGGLIRSLPQLWFGTDGPHVAAYPPTEIVISEADEEMFSSLGFIPLFTINQSTHVATLSSQTPQVAKRMTTQEATNNIRLSMMFNYMLCACRMAHRLKLECQGQVGRSNGPDEFQNQIQTWLMQHSSGRNRGLSQKMVKPFLDEQSGFFVEEDVTDPGRYDCRIELCPHHKFDSGRTRLVFEPVSLQMQFKSDEERK